MKRVIEWWVSCKRFTCWVKTQEGVIIDTAPLLKIWRKQSFIKMIKYYGADCKRLKEEK